MSHPDSEKALELETIALSLASANWEIYDRLRDRVKVTYRDTDEEDITENVTITDWQRFLTQEGYNLLKFTWSGTNNTTKI